MFFLETVIFILKWVNLQKMVRNQNKICPGKKFVTNEYPGIYILANYSWPFLHNICLNCLKIVGTPIQNSEHS